MKNTNTNTVGNDSRSVELEQIRSELAKFDGRTDMTPDDVKAGNELLDRQERIEQEIAAERSFEERRTAAHERFADAMRSTRATVERVDDIDDEAQERSRDVKGGRNPWDLDAITRNLHNGDELASRALDAAEKTPGISDQRRQALTEVLERGEGEVAQMVLTTTSPAYKRAFGMYLRSGGDMASLGDSERQALAFAEPLRRAMAAATNNAGGYLVPTDIEPSVTLSSDGTTNPLYSIGRRVQTTSNTYRVVTAPHAAWSWDGENTEVSDDTPTFANTDITLHYAQGFVPMSIASTQSIQGAVGIARDVLNGGWNDLVGAALTSGTGSGQPTGILTALDGTASELAPATAETFAVADVYTVHESIAARHRRNAQWMANMAIINDIRQFATDDGHALLARLGDGTPGNLLGARLNENPDMDGVINTSATEDNFVLLFGDFQHFVIAEGIGTLAEVIPHVFGSNGRPIGARGLYMATRFGSGCVLPAAFGVLNVATTA